jgi:hypothetical protein
MAYPALQLQKQVQKQQLVDLTKKKKAELEIDEQCGSGGSDDITSEDEDDRQRITKRLRKKSEQISPKKNKFSQEPLRLDDIKNALNERIVGQAYAIEILSPVLNTIHRRLRVPLEATQRVYTILTAGPTGTGKTELVRAVCTQFGCGQGQELAYLVHKEDMGTVFDSSSFNKYTGVGQGYSGYGDKSLITHFNEAITTFNDKYNQDPPYLVLILDELDKATHQVYNIFNSLFDKGELCGGSDKFVLPLKTFLLIFITTNYGEETNDKLLPATSVDKIKKEMLSVKIDPCDVGRMRLILPFFELTESDRKIIAGNALKKILFEYGHHKKMSSRFLESYTNYLMRRTQKDTRSMEKELIDAFDAVFNAHESRYSGNKNNFIIDFENAYVDLDIGIGDFRIVNQQHHAEYDHYICMYNTVDPYVPCVVLRVNGKIYQTYVLPFNQFTVVSSPMLTQMPTTAALSITSPPPHQQSPHFYESFYYEHKAAEIESFEREKEEYERKKIEFVEDTQKMINAVQEKANLVHTAFEDIKLMAEKMNNLNTMDVM